MLKRIAPLRQRARSQMINHAEACPPLELPSGAMLRLSYNGTFPARWDVRLGWCKQPPRKTALADVRAAGGVVPLLDVVVLRRYGWQYMEGGPPAPRAVVSTVG